jgi:hypothetical protein
MVASSRGGSESGHRTHNHGVLKQAQNLVAFCELCNSEDSEFTFATKDRLNMNAPHISIERAVAFLIHDGELDPSEEEHLLRCDECRRLVAEAVTRKLKHPPDGSIGKKSDS